MLPTNHDGPAHIKIYVVSHGWHTGLVLPSDEIKRNIPLLENRFPDAAYLEFGWGDRAFYQAEAMTTKLTLRAVLWPTESVVHVVSIPANVESLFENSEMYEICLTRSEYKALFSFISDSFHRNAADKIIELGPGIDADSQFYRGAGKYSLINTCNSWTAKGLKSAGLHILYANKLTAGSVMNYLQSHREAVRVGSSARSSVPCH